MKESPSTAREYLAALPAECIGTDRILSRALYRLAYDSLQKESVGAVFQLANRYGRETTLEHLVLLPDKAYHWIVEGFCQLLDDQKETETDELIQMSVFLGQDMKTGGVGWQTLAPKAWAADFLQETVRRRP